MKVSLTFSVPHWLLILVVPPSDRERENSATCWHFQTCLTESDGILKKKRTKHLRSSRQSCFHSPSCNYVIASYKLKSTFSHDRSMCSLFPLEAPNFNIQTLKSYLAWASERGRNDVGEVSSTQSEPPPEGPTGSIPRRNIRLWMAARNSVAHKSPAAGAGSRWDEVRWRVRQLTGEAGCR